MSQLLKSYRMELPSVMNMDEGLLQLSQESEHIANLIGVFRQIIPHFKSAIITAAETTQNYISGNTEITSELSRKQKNAIEESRKLDFVNFSERRINIPENFKGSLVDYSKHLINITSDLYTINSTTLAEYNTILSSFLTNKADKISLKDHTELFKKVEVKREAIVKILGDYTKDTGKSQVKLRQVINRFSDLPLLFENINRLSEIQNKSVIVNINLEMKKCISLLDIIITRVNEGDITNLSAAAASNISKGAYEVAKLCELAGVVFYDTNVLLKIVDELATAILKD